MSANGAVQPFGIGRDEVVNVAWRAMGRAFSPFDISGVKPGALPQAGMRLHRWCCEPARLR